MRQPVREGGTLVLDSAGLSGFLTRERKVMSLLELAERQDRELVMAAATLIEAVHKRTPAPRTNWVLSRIRVEPLTLESARRSAALLQTCGLHGNKYAIDAMVAEVALRQPAPVAVVTSDEEDLSRLCGDRVRLIVV